MDCRTSNNKSAKVEHHEDKCNNRHINDSCRGVNNDDSQINKATSSGSNPTEREEDEHQVQKLSATTMLVVKGKRTKRQRLHSPSPILSSSSLTYYNARQGPDDEQLDLDVANCLILLANGQSRLSSSPPPPPPHSLIARSQSGLLTKLSLSGNKRRRSYSSSSLSLAGVYECKNCNRTFPSFQALGGHRASHMNKLKITTSYSDYSVNPDNNSSPYCLIGSSALSLQLGNIEYGRAILTLLVKLIRLITVTDFYRWI